VAHSPAQEWLVISLLFYKHYQQPISEEASEERHALLLPSSSFLSYISMTSSEILIIILLDPILLTSLMELMEDCRNRAEWNRGEIHEREGLETGLRGFETNQRWTGLVVLMKAVAPVGSEKGFAIRKSTYSEPAQSSTVR
jgi:hypothetical protein